MLETSTNAKDKQSKNTEYRDLGVIIKIIAFILILILLLPPIATCLKSNYTSRIHEFYKEKKDSLDVVFKVPIISPLSINCRGRRSPFLAFARREISILSSLESSPNPLGRI